LMTCGAFIGIAFQPFIWYTIAMSTSLHAWVRRVETEQAPALVPAVA